MASDRQQVDRAESHRGRLLEENKLSLPPESGRMAILAMYDTSFLDKVVIAEDRPENMDLEGRRIQRYLQWRGKNTVYLPDASIEDFWEVLDDETISDITVIGLAKLGLIHVNPWQRTSGQDKQHTTMNFFEAVSRGGNWPVLSHLKQGSFYQRTSGGMDMVTLNIPLAWGFMADRAKVWAVPECTFYPGKWHIQPKAGLVNVARYFGLCAAELNGVMTYTRAKELFGRRESVRLRDHRIPQFAYPVYDRLRNSERLFGVHQRIRKMVLSWPSNPSVVDGASVPPSGGTDDVDAVRSA